MQDKKNYSFYMPEDFDKKIDLLRENIDSLHGLSKSQSVYFLISELAAKQAHVSDDNKKISEDLGQ